MKYFFGSLSMPIAELYIDANDLLTNVIRAYRPMYIPIRTISTTTEEGSSMRTAIINPDALMAAINAGMQLFIILAGCRLIAQRETTRVIAVNASWDVPAAIEKQTQPLFEETKRSGTRTRRYRSSTSIEYFGFPRLL